VTGADNSATTRTEARKRRRSQASKVHDSATRAGERIPLCGTAIELAHASVSAVSPRQTSYAQKCFAPERWGGPAFSGRAALYRGAQRYRSVSALRLPHRARPTPALLAWSLQHVRQRASRLR
jgi:hypothetical protein